MIQFYFLVMLCAVGIVTSADNEFKTCKITWKKVGCFKDLRKDRTLPEQLANIRDPKSKVYTPPRLDWLHLSDSWRSLACQCANLTSQKGYKVFGLQFYGECWSAPNGLNTYDKHNTADDEKCVMEIDWNAGAWVHCDIASDEACVGKDNTNYIYILEEEPQTPNNGGWSEWGDWTQCDKTCGTGKQVRERTCTNPPPDPAGKDCEGPAEETRSCNLKECPIDGGWGPWKPVPECTKTCGGGEQKFIRTCTSPPPQHGGKDCTGLKEKIGPCNDFTCPIPCTRAIDLGVILDATNSVGELNFNRSKKFALHLVNSMTVAPGASHLGLIVYNIYAKIKLAFNELDKQNPETIKGILKATTELKGRTYTDRALRMADKLFNTTMGDRSDKPDVLVVLTDGRTNVASEPYETVLVPLEKKGIKVIAVGVGNNIRHDELKRIAMGKDENVFQVSDFVKLPEKLQDIINSSCQDKF